MLVCLHEFSPGSRCGSFFFVVWVWLIGFERVIKQWFFRAASKQVVLNLLMRLLDANAPEPRDKGAINSPLAIPRKSKVTFEGSCRSV